ncbi:MAG: rhodanese-like domain-containing protein [Actinomycetota bacterium]
MSDLEQVRDVYDRKDDVQILDVREPYEWEAGRIDGAIHVPLNDLMGGKGADQLDPEKPVAVICRSGNRSELASLMLKAKGFDAYNVRGGMEGWDREGLPYTTPSGEPGRVA